MTRPAFFGALHTDPHWSHILAALTRLADYLDDHAIPIDYDRRRDLDHTSLLPEDQWHHICLQSRFPPDNVAAWTSHDACSSRRSA